MHSSTYVVRDLAEHVPGHALIAKLLTEWEAGRIRPGEVPDEVIIDDESRGWYWGVLGERKAAEVLATLAPHFVTLHSIPIGSQGADVDHLTIGPSGVFTINTKYHPGAHVWAAGHGLLVNRISQAKYLRNSAHEAKRVEAKLSAAAGFTVPVYPVIAFVDVAAFTQKATSSVDGVDIRVTTASRLAAALTTRRELSDEQIARVIVAARNPSTWQKTLRPSPPGTHLAREFDALRGALGPALEPARRPVKPVGTRTSRSTQRSSNSSRRAPQRQQQRLGRTLLSGCLGFVVLVLFGVLLTQLLPVLMRALIPH